MPNTLGGIEHPFIGRVVGAMVKRVIDTGAGRRRVVRGVLGGPGSMRRSLLGSLVIVYAAAILLVRAGFLGRIAIFILATVLVATVFRASALVIGDEDELSAHIRVQLRAARVGPPESDECVVRVSEEDWQRGQVALRAREQGALDLPQAPAFDDAEMDSVATSDGGRGSA